MFTTTRCCSTKTSKSHDKLPDPTCRKKLQSFNNDNACVARRRGRRRWATPKEVASTLSSPPNNVHCIAKHMFRRAIHRNKQRTNAITKSKLRERFRLCRSKFEVLSSGSMRNHCWATHSLDLTTTVASNQSNVGLAPVKCLLQ